MESIYPREIWFLKEIILSRKKIIIKRIIFNFLLDFYVSAQIPCKNGTFQCQLSKRCIPLGKFMTFLSKWNDAVQTWKLERVLVNWFLWDFSADKLFAGWLCDGTSDCGFTEGYLLDQSDEQNEQCKWDGGVKTLGNKNVYFYEFSIRGVRQ